MPGGLNPQLHRHPDGVEDHLIGLQVDGGAKVLQQTNRQQWRALHDDEVHDSRPAKGDGSTSWSGFTSSSTLTR